MLKLLLLLLLKAKQLFYFILLWLHDALTDIEMSQPEKTQIIQQEILCLLVSCYLRCFASENNKQRDFFVLQHFEFMCQKRN